MVSNEEGAFQKAIKENPDDRLSRLAYADWLEDHGRKIEALEQRVKAGVSEAQYRLRRKSDGLFSDGNGRGARWSGQGKIWRKLGDIKSHIAHLSNYRLYGGNTAWDDLEIVLFEVRPQHVATLPFSLGKGTRFTHEVIVEEPRQDR